MDQLSEWLIRIGLGILGACVLGWAILLLTTRWNLNKDEEIDDEEP